MAVSVHQSEETSIHGLSCAVFSMMGGVWREIVKKYHEKICVYAENQSVCTHKRAFRNGTMQIDIMH